MKSNLTKRFLMDSTKEEQGVWMPFGDGIEVKIRRFKSKPSQDALSEFQKPYLNMIRRGTLPEATQMEIVEKQMAKAIVVDWKGVVDEENNPIPCTYENKLSILKSLPEFRDEIANIAASNDVFRAELDEDTEKN